MNKESCGGPDGFNAIFFTSCWEIIKFDFVNAVNSFFKHNKMLSGIIATNIALIPKTEHPISVTDFRPISCCNTTYKCLSKIIAYRLKVVLSHISPPTKQLSFRGEVF